MKINPFPFPCIILAPLSGITSSPFRRIAKKHGASWVWSEMISSDALLMRSVKTLSMIKFKNSERPIAIQLFGSDPGIVAATASFVEHEVKPDMIDFNIGCPAKKIARSGSGAILMKDPKRVKEILKALASSVSIPVSVKIRSGWDTKNALKIAEIAREACVPILTIHPRLGKQGFNGHAEWEIIKEIKRHIDIILIGNGDIKTPEDALRMFDYTGCDAVMIGRAALTNPWILGNTVCSISGNKKYELQPKISELKSTIFQHIKYAKEYYGENKAVLNIRKHIFWYTKGLPKSGALRNKVTRVISIDKLKNLLDIYFENIPGKDHQN